MVSEKRLAINFERMSTITAPGQGITRIAFSDEDWQARNFIIELMKEAGLTIRTDHFGNVIGRLEGTDPNAKVVMLGSHIDSVPNGGNFDGVVGVLGAIEVIHCMKEANFVNDHPIEVVVFMSEESSRFGVATLGSKTMRGEMDVHTLKKLVDEKGHSLYNILKLHGLDADKIDEAVYPHELKAFMELHIEQGKVLEVTDSQIGIVTGIAAPTRLKVIINGQADHSGATPMTMRQDALCAAAEIILQVEELAKTAKESSVVGTTGIIHAHPGVMNVVPGKVELGIDIRSIYMETKIKIVKAVMAQIKTITENRNLTADITTLTNETPVKLKEEVISFLDDICKEKNYAYMQLPSGAGHDAMHWAHNFPTGMIFIPCKNGISHNPAEHAKMKDIVAGTEVLYTAICKLASKEFSFK